MKVSVSNEALSSPFSKLQVCTEQELNDCFNHRTDRLAFLGLATV